MPTETTTSQTIPYGSDYYDDIYRRAQDLYTNQQGISPYTGQEIAGMSQQRTDALGLAEQQARAGTPFLGALNQQIGGTLRGDFLSPESNPYLKATYDQAARSVGETFRDYTQPQTDAQALMAGRYGSGALANERARNTDTFGRTLNELATGIYAPAYEAERNRQLDVMRFAPDAQQMQYVDPARLAMVGQEFEQDQQRRINADMARFYAAQERPFDALNRYGNTIGNLGYGGTQTGSYHTPRQGLNTGQLVGLGLSGLAGMSQLGGAGRTLGGIAGRTLGNIGNFLGF